MPRPKLSKALQEIEDRIDRSELLTEEDKATIRTRAREEVAKRRKESAEKEFLDAAIKEEERAYLPHEQLEEVFINLPEHAPFIRLDQVVYFHGLSYTVPYSVARVMADVMARAQEHQNEIDGKRRRGDLMMRHHNDVLSGTGMHRVTTRSSMTGII